MGKCGKMAGKRRKHGKTAKRRAGGGERGDTDVKIGVGGAVVVVLGGGVVSYSCGGAVPTVVGCVRVFAFVEYRCKVG